MALGVSVGEPNFQLLPQFLQFLLPPPQPRLNPAFADVVCCYLLHLPLASQRVYDLSPVSVPSDLN